MTRILTILLCGIFLVGCSNSGQTEPYLQGLKVDPMSSWSPKGGTLIDHTEQPYSETTLFFSKYSPATIQNTFELSDEEQAQRALQAGRDAAIQQGWTPLGSFSNELNQPIEKDGHYRNIIILIPPDQPTQLILSLTVV